MHIYKPSVPSGEMTVVKEMINILLPPRCYICSSSILRDKYTNICDSCLKELKDSVFNSPEKIALKESNLYLYYFSKYTGSVKKIIHLLKFQKNTDLTSIFREIFSAPFSSLLKLLNPDTITYIPSHFIKKLVIRGFDQNEILLKTLIDRENIYKLRKILKRKRYTSPLYNLSLQQRQKQLNNAFSARQCLIEDRKLIIFDDIYTSGTTVMEAVKSIRVYKPEKIDIISLCHGY